MLHPSGDKTNHANVEDYLSSEGDTALSGSRRTTVVNYFRLL